MRTFLSFGLLCFGLTLTSSAQVAPVSTNAPKYVPAGTVDVPELGIRYVLDEGWEQQAETRLTQRDLDNAGTVRTAYPPGLGNPVIMGMNFYVSTNANEIVPPEATPAEQAAYLEANAAEVWYRFLHIHTFRAETWLQRVFFERGWCTERWPLVDWLNAHCTMSIEAQRFNLFSRRAAKGNVSMQTLQHARARGALETFGPDDPRMPFASGTGFVYDSEAMPNTIATRTYEFFVVQHGYRYHLRADLLVHNHDESWPKLKAILESIEFSEPTH